MTLIDKTYFVGELDIANTGNPNVESRLNKFIEKYEPEFLRILFGDTLYTNYAEGIDVVDPDPVPEIWVNLQDVEGLKNAIACYVYFHFMRDKFTQTVSLGEVRPKAENASVEDPSWKITRAWNEMVRWIKANTLVEFLNTNIADYPGWVAPESYQYWYRGVWRTTSVLWREFRLINPVLDL
jgi:hypothetical protein